MSWKLTSASTMPLSAAWLCVPKTLLLKHLRWLKRKTSAVSVAMISLAKPQMLKMLGILKSNF